MIRSHQKWARIVLVAVLILSSVILFQNCGKKMGLVSVLNDASTTPNESLNYKEIEIKIRTSSGLNSPEVNGDLDPEEKYYIQVRNVSLNGYLSAGH